MCGWQGAENKLYNARYFLRHLIKNLLDQFIHFDIDFMNWLAAQTHKCKQVVN